LFLIATSFLVNKDEYNIFETEQLCRVPSRNCKLGRDKTNSVHTAFRDRTKLQKNPNMFSFKIFCRRQSWLVSSSVHTADTDVLAVWTRHYILEFHTDGALQANERPPKVVSLNIGVCVQATLSFASSPVCDFPASYGNVP